MSNAAAEMLQFRVAHDLGEAIKKAGKKRKEVAAAIGVSEAALSIKLAGDANLTLQSISDICQAIGCSADLRFVFHDGISPAGGEAEHG